MSRERVPPRHAGGVALVWLSGFLPLGTAPARWRSWTAGPSAQGCADRARTHTCNAASKGGLSPRLAARPWLLVTWRDIPSPVGPACRQQAAFPAGSRAAPRTHATAAPWQPAPPGMARCRRPCVCLSQPPKPLDTAVWAAGLEPGRASTASKHKIQSTIPLGGETTWQHGQHAANLPANPRRWLTGVFPPSFRFRQSRTAIHWLEIEFHPPPRTPGFRSSGLSRATATCAVASP